MLKFKDKMVQELEQEFLKEGNEQEKEGKAGLKFLDKFVEKREGAIKNEAAKLLKSLKENKQFEYFIYLFFFQSSLQKLK